MAKTSTHFEQIPVEVVRKIAIRQTDKNTKAGAGTAIRKPESPARHAPSPPPERDPSKRRRLADGRRRPQRVATNRYQVETL